MRQLALAVVTSGKCKMVVLELGQCYTGLLRLLHHTASVLHLSIQAEICDLEHTISSEF